MQVGGTVPRQHKGPVSLVPQAGSKKGYTEAVRYYTTKQMNGATTFKCVMCEHCVTTLDFDSANGNRRTQAAAAMNQHAADLHLRGQVPALVKLGGRGAL